MLNPTWQDFGPFLRRVRQRRGLSQQKIADALGCHRIYIWRLEHGTRHPSRFLLRLLSYTCPLNPSEQHDLAAFEELLY
jgi:transcriptional regulator with XRE-family HTH domain